MLQNVHRVEGDIAYISLTRGQEALIDTEDLAKILQYRWRAQYNKHVQKFYVYSGNTIMHHVIIATPQGMWVSYANHNPLDNRKGNLRFVTPAESALHRRDRVGETGVKHVSYTDTGRWKGYNVSIMRNGIAKRRGFPATPEGWQAACELAERWEKDPSYDPPKQQRFGRLGPHETPEREQKYIPHMVPVVAEGQWLTEGDVSYLGLNDGQVTIVDTEDIARMQSYTWRAMQMQGEGSSWYVYQTFNRYLHRFLMDAPFGIQVDHWNHDTLDNRKDNLRIVTNQVNNANRAGAYHTSKTGIRGVSIHKGNGKHPQLYVFRCHIVTCKASKYFPFSDEGFAAAKAYSEAHYAAIKDA